MGGRIELIAGTGEWEGAEPAATMANAIAQLKDATPDKGDPVLWVVNEVAKVVKGRVQVMNLDKRKTDGNTGRVY